MNNNLKYLLIAILSAFLLGGLAVWLLVPSKVEKVPIIKENVIIKESVKTFDSLAVELEKSRIVSKKLKDEKDKLNRNHKPLQRVAVTDSIRTNNVSRFYK